MMARPRARRKLPDSITMPSRFRRNRGFFLAVLLIAAVVVCDRTRTRVATPPPRNVAVNADFFRYHGRTFSVARVVDGDTLDIDAPDAGKPTTRIRLWGVDTPETGLGRTVEMFFGPEASAFAKSTLEGKRVHVVLSPRRTRGKYSRLLAYVFLERGGTMFNELLLEEGYAYADRRFPHHYKQQFEAIEKRARREGAGLWGSVEIDDMPPWRQRFERSDAKKRGRRTTTP